LPLSVARASRYASDTFSSSAIEKTARSGSVPSAMMPWLAMMNALSPLATFFCTFLARNPVPDGAYGMIDTCLPRKRTCSSVSAGISLRRKASADAYGWWVCTIALTSGRSR
jgi:hypothetical protein